MSHPGPQAPGSSFALHESWQRWWVASQASTHCCPSQRVLPFEEVGQTRQAAPHEVVAVAGTQMPPQRFFPLGQAAVTASHRSIIEMQLSPQGWKPEAHLTEQRPLSQVGSPPLIAGQESQELPQVRGSVLSTQTPLQRWSEDATPLRRLVRARAALDPAGGQAANDQDIRSVVPRPELCGS